MPAIRMLLDEVDWSSGLASSLQQSILNSSQLQLCMKDFTSVSLVSAPSRNLPFDSIGITISARTTPKSKLQVCSCEQM